MCKILIADDHPLVRDALRSALDLTFQGNEIFEAATLDETMEAVGRLGDLDLVLLDLNMPGMNGFQGLLALRARFPGAPVVVVSAFDDRKVILEAIHCGAAGFIPKSTSRDGIAVALRQIMAGAIYLPPCVAADTAANTAEAEAAEDTAGSAETAETAEDVEIARRLSTLTAQQRRVLEMLGTGKLNKEIAFDLNIAETTVKAHVSAILQKLKVYSRTQAVVFASRLRFAKDPAPR